jgi:hypothetical protein
MDLHTYYRHVFFTRKPVLEIPFYRDENVEQSYW